MCRNLLQFQLKTKHNHSYSIRLHVPKEYKISYLVDLLYRIPMYEELSSTMLYYILHTYEALDYHSNDSVEIIKRLLFCQVWLPTLLELIQKYLFYFKFGFKDKNAPQRYHRLLLLNAKLNDYCCLFRIWISYLPKYGKGADALYIVDWVEVYTKR